MQGVVIVRGGGDLASGVILRLVKVGLRVAVTELPQPLAVRRLVAFGQAVYSGEINIEGVTGRLAANVDDARSCLEKGIVPVLVDPECNARLALNPVVIVDGRMTKLSPQNGKEFAPLVIGLGPGFIAGENCHAVIETMRGHHLGRVLWTGSAESDTGVPERVGEHGNDRVLRAPIDGVFIERAKIGSVVQAGDIIAEVSGYPIKAAFKGALRGLIQSGLHVKRGLKVGDLDPRADPKLCSMVSDKALSVGGAVLEAMLTKPDIRKRLWE